MIPLFAVCSVSVLPIRKEPAHRAEQVSQMLWGERAEVFTTDKNGWSYIRCEWDNYEGWVKDSQLVRIGIRLFRRRLHFINISTNDYLLNQQDKSLLSPGSSLFLLIGKHINLNTSIVQFRGKKINLKKTTSSKDNVIKFSNIFIGTPYQWGGRSILGIDCSGFVQVVFKLMNIRLPRDAYQQAQKGESVGFLQEAKCGDLAFFNNEEGNINHVGILLDSQTIIHATDTSGKVVIDSIDTIGIISRQLKKRTHQLRLIKRYF